jgi:hypothetical protein
MQKANGLNPPKSVSHIPGNWLIDFSIGRKNYSWGGGGQAHYVGQFAVVKMIYIFFKCKYSCFYAACFGEHTDYGSGDKHYVKNCNRRHKLKTSVQ